MTLATPATGQTGTGEDDLVPIVEELTARLQAGERVDVEDYVRAHPEHGDRLRQLVPALGVLAELGKAPLLEGRGAAGTPPLAGQLGDFRIVREIGRGGMGVVYEAVQISLGRRVALKVLPFAAALDSKQLQRFKNEAQAAAGLQHTNIVPVYFVGCERGVHFYAMQFVEGQTLAALIQELRQVEGWEGEAPSEPRPLESGLAEPVPHGPAESPPTGPYAPPAPVDQIPQAATVTPPFGALSTEHSTSRPAFFRTVATLGIQAAEALEHAHQLGVIHRDIKPANLMVDARGNLWITDFGLAHCQSQAGLTMSGDLVGTLRYMSPEQALAKRVMVDHRTDIYSLGATLYELLTLEPPFAGTDRQELLRQIAFEEPRPPRRWNKRIPAELETIVLKAVEKNPDDRYATAQELADDLERFVKHEPIRAKKPTLIQRASKWFRRHPAIVRSSVLMLFLITVGSLLSTWLIWQEKKQTGLERDRAEANEKLANDQRERAEEEKRIAQAVRDFLRYKLLDQADVENQADALLQAGLSSVEAKPNATIRELLDRAAAELTPERIEASFPDQPLVQAEILKTVGDTYRGLGEYAQAIAHLERASRLRESLLGPDHPYTLITMDNLALAYKQAGKLPQAIHLFEQMREKSEQSLGPDHLDTLIILHNLASAYSAIGRVPEAIRLQEYVLEKRSQMLGRDHPATLEALNGLATEYVHSHRLPQAIRLFEEVRSKQEGALGPDHPVTLNTMNNLAVAYHYAGRLADAIDLYELVRRKCEQKLGPDNPKTLNAVNNLAGAFHSAGRYAEAIRLFEQIRPKDEQKLGPDHPYTLSMLRNLAEVYKDSGRLPEAIRLFEQVREKQEQKVGADHPHTLDALSNLAGAYWVAGNLDRSVPLFEDLLRRTRAKSGTDHPQTYTVAFNLGVNYRDAGRLDDAVRIFDEWLARAQANLQPGQEPLVWGRSEAADAYERAGRFDRAIPLWQEGVADARRTLAAADPFQRHLALGSLGLSLLRARQPEEAETVMRECLAIREKKEPDAWTTFNAGSLLGGALLGQKKYAEAEPLLVQGYEGIKQREAKIPMQTKVRLTQALERLVQLYDAWGKPDKANEWRKKLEEDKAKAKK